MVTLASIFRLPERLPIIYEMAHLATEVMRCDATPVSGDHGVTEAGLWQFGHSKDDPPRPQITVMIGALDPLGLPLSVDVLSGERADDGLYLARIDRIRAGLKKTGRLFVGDCQMSALATRGHVASHQHLYLSPLPLTGTTAEAMDDWIAQGLRKAASGELEQMVRTTARGHEVLAAEGYEFERTCWVRPGEAEWPERVLVVRSPAHAARQAAGLETRLSQAENKLAALTPPRGRGKRQITDEASLLAAIASVLRTHRVEGLLGVEWEKQVERRTHYVGRGRGAARREKRVSEKIRYHITRIARQAAPIAALTGRFGSKAFVTNASRLRLSLKQAVLCYRNAYRVERIFNRLKSPVQIAPMFVTLDAQIEGLTHLLTLGVRVVTVLEFVLRRSLEKAGAALPGLPPDNKQKRTAKPTAERVLKAFAGVSLIVIKHACGTELMRQLTTLSMVQAEILHRLGLGTALYERLEIEQIGN